MCRMYTSSKDTLLTHPPNITARFSSIIVREKLAQGGGLEPITDGDDQDPKEREIVDIELINIITLL